MSPDLIAECGCEIRNPDGTLNDNVMRAVAFEANLIQKKGYASIPDVGMLLDARVTKEPGNPNEGQNPRDHVEYRFGLESTDIASSDFLASGQASQNVLLGGASTATQLNNIGSLGCDPRSVNLIGGRDEYRGTFRQLAPIETPCVCVLDFARNKDFPDYLRGVRNSMPQEAMFMKERDLLRRLVELAKWNTSEPGAAEPTFNAGQFPYEPQGAANLATFRLMRDLVLAQKPSLGKINVPISFPSLQSMMIHEFQNTGMIYQARDWMSGNFQIQPGGKFEFENIEFEVTATPIRATLDRDNSGQFHLVPLSQRKWRAGTGGGVMYDLNPDYRKPFITVGGATKSVFEVIPIIAPGSFTQQPFVMSDPGVEGVKLEEAMWSGTTVRVVSGPFIPNNTRYLKWFFQLDHVYKLVPRNPYLSGFVIVQSPTYKRTPNLIGLANAQEASGGVPIVIGAGRQPNASSVADANAGLPAGLPAPVTRTDGCADVTNGAGEFFIQCSVNTKVDAGTLKVNVERRGGTDGAASLAYATHNNTAHSGTDYTSESGTLHWADGEGGVKSISIPILSGGAGSKNFYITYGSASGATVASESCTQTDVNICPAAEDISEYGCPPNS